MSILNALTFDSRRVTAEGLKRLNITLAALMVVCAVAVAALGYSPNSKSVLSLNYLSRDTLASEFSGKTSFANAVKPITTLNVAYLASAVLVLYAVGLLLIATRYRQLYEQDMKRGFNRARAFLQSPVLGLIMVLSGLLVGISDTGLLFLMFCLGGSIPYLLLNHERQNVSRNSYDRPSLLLLWLPSIAILIVLAIYLIASAIYGSGLGYYAYLAYVAVVIYFVGLRSKLTSSKGAVKIKKYLFLERNLQLMLSALLIIVSAMVLLYAR